MLDTIPCAASLCELSEDNIEILRINDEYLAMTCDSAERIYNCGTTVRNLAAEGSYGPLLALSKQRWIRRGSPRGFTNVSPKRAKSSIPC